MLDVPTNWRRWNGWMAGKGQPDPEEGVILMLNPECSVLVTEAFEISEMRDWIRSHTRSRVQFHGRWDFTRFAYRIERELIGLNLWFDDEDEAFHAKMRWG
ncbi:hypothetical protein [Brevundimonas sp. NPDC058933]|uniref:hypothetical protein n=1 Tax=Brevundimonas sp. NPDC058933 TaxID=3346673 RepID=UPI003BEF0316